MSASLLRGLRILEMLQDEPLGTTEIARRLEVDKGGVSRVLTALQREGWVERTGRRFVLGVRSLSLVDESTRGLLAEADALADRLHRDTGHTVAVLQRRGAGAQPLAMREATSGSALREHVAPYEHLVATAGGIALLAQLPDETVDEYVAVTPWPLTSPSAPTGPDRVRALVTEVRSGSPVVEHSWTVPGQACLALPWPGHPWPLAVAVVGPDEELSAQGDTIIHRLRAALVR